MVIWMRGEIDWLNDKLGNDKRKLCVKQYLKWKYIGFLLNDKLSVLPFWVQEAFSE